MSQLFTAVIIKCKFCNTVREIYWVLLGQRRCSGNMRWNWHNFVSKMICMHVSVCDGESADELWPPAICDTNRKITISPSGFADVRYIGWEIWQTWGWASLLQLLGHRRRAEHEPLGLTGNTLSGNTGFLIRCSHPADLDQGQIALCWNDWCRTCELIHFQQRAQKTES